MKCTRYLPALKSIVAKRAPLGERVMASLFPNRATGWPGGWSQDRLEQSLHYRNWAFVAIDTILCKIASLTPNLAYVTDAPKPGVTQKAGWRDPGFFLGATNVEAKNEVRKVREDYQGWIAPHSASLPSLGFGGGSDSFLTMGAYRSKALSVVKPHEDLEPLENDHPLRRLIDNPNTQDTYFDFMYEMGMFGELQGVDYTWLVPNQFGMPCEAWVFPSHWVWPRTGGGQYVHPDNPHADELISYYEVRPWGGMGSSGILRVPPNEIIANRWKSPINKIDGYSKLFAIAQWVDSEESITKSRWAQFMNQARPELVIKLGAGYEDPDDDRIARLENKIAEKHQGEFNYGKPLIVPPGADTDVLSYSPTEMAYYQSEEQIRDMILSTFRVPPSAVGIVKEMTYGSILATLAALCSFCINPRLAMRGMTLTKHLAKRWDETTPAYSQQNGAGGRGSSRKVRIWWDDCVPADPEQVNADLDVDARNGWITPNEGRALRGRRQYRFGGDDPLVAGPGGLVPLPLNTGSDQSELAELMKPLTEAEGEMPPEESENAAETQNNGDGERAETNSPSIESPNGKPKKRWKSAPPAPSERKPGGRHQIEPSDHSTPSPDSLGKIVSTYGKYKVRSVSGKAIRALSPEAQEFTNLAIHVDFPKMIPDDEIWIADTVRKQEYQFFVANALGQLKALHAGVDRDVAYDRGITAEHIERDKWEESVRKRTGLEVPNIQDGIRLRKLGIVNAPEPVEVWEVNGELVRHFYKSDFDEGGHSLVYTWMPPTELWIDDDVPEEERPLILLHEATERTLMKRDGLGYEEAHEQASKVEWEKRHAGHAEPAEKGLAFDTVQAAGKWLAKKWQALEDRYGRKQALAMAIGALVTFPIPGNIAAIVAAAEAVRGIHGLLTDKEVELAYKGETLMDTAPKYTGELLAHKNGVMV